MNDKSLTKKVKSTAIRMNADFIGIADPYCFQNPEYIGNKPQDVMADIRSVIVVGVGVPRGAFDALPNGRPE
jgi:epoxyqueuosine reductase QueG